MEAGFPEIGGMPGDYLVVRPGHPDPLSLARFLPTYALAHVLPRLEEMEFIQGPPEDPRPRGRRREGPRTGLRLVR
jgi:hypothetical protein